MQQAKSAKALKTRKTSGSPFVPQKKKGRKPDSHENLKIRRAKEGASEMGISLKGTAGEKGYPWGSLHYNGRRGPSKRTVGEVSQREHAHRTTDGSLTETDMRPRRVKRVLKKGKGLRVLLGEKKDKLKRRRKRQGKTGKASVWSGGVNGRLEAHDAQFSTLSQGVFNEARVPTDIQRTATVHHWTRQPNAGPARVPIAPKTDKKTKIKWNS